MKCWRLEKEVEHEEEDGHGHGDGDGDGGGDAPPTVDRNAGVGSEKKLHGAQRSIY